MCLYEAVIGDLDVLVVGSETSILQTRPASFLAGNTFFCEIKQNLSVEKVKLQFLTAGYTLVGQVVSPGEYSVRGNIVDIFAMGSKLPFRIEFFDEQIETIRLFDPDTQRSVHPVNEIRILPSKEFVNNKENADKFRLNWRDTFEGDPTRSSLYKDAGNGIFGAGIEYYLPFLHDKTESILIIYQMMQKFFVLEIFQHQ